MKAKLIIFDLDGTLINSVADLTTALNLTLEELNLPILERELVARHIGSGTKKLLALELKKYGREDYPEALKIFQKHYLNHLSRETHLYPGILALLEQLKDREKIILTNKSSDFLEPLLTNLDIRKFFTAVYGWDSFPTAKPDPGPLFEISKLHKVSLQEMILIGDTESDILAGKASGVSTCAVTWGYGNEAELKSYNPEMMVSSPEKIPERCGL